MQFELCLGSQSLFKFTAQLGSKTKQYTGVKGSLRMRLQISGCQQWIMYMICGGCAKCATQLVFETRIHPALKVNPHKPWTAQRDVSKTNQGKLLLCEATVHLYLQMSHTEKKQFLPLQRSNHIPEYSASHFNHSHHFIIFQSFTAWFSVDRVQHNMSFMYFLN